MRHFTIIPVLDLKNGIVVRGIAGQRDQYLPNHSQWTSSTDPLETAIALQQQLGFEYFYVADLDAIQGESPQGDSIQQLTEHGFRILLDAGIQNVEQAQSFLNLGVDDLVIGLETFSDWSTLAAMVDLLSPEHLTFSLDLRSGKPLGPLGDQRPPLEVVAEAWKHGVHRFIILDLAAVGTGHGVPTLNLCRSIRDLFPEAHLITGGGVHSNADIDAIRDADLDGVLVASALHDGRLTLPR